MPLPLPVRRSFVALLLLSLSCRRSAPGLEPAQQTAYLARPAVVRIDAFATAKFGYRASAIRQIASQLREQGSDPGEPQIKGAEASVETGAGGSGSGFIVRPDGVIVTSGHVVAPARDARRLEADLRTNGATAALIAHFPMSVLRQLHDRELLQPLIGRLASEGSLSSVRLTTDVELSTGSRRKFRILAFSPSISEHGFDLALLRIAADGLPTVPLADSETVRVGTSVWALGYPAVASSRDEVIGGWLSSATDLEPTFDPGTITAIRRNVNGAGLFQTNVAIYAGNSGGPVVDAAGSVVGVSTFGHAAAEQIRFLVPSSAVAGLLREAALAPASSEFDERYRRAVALAAVASWKAAKDDAAAAAELFPGSPDVIRLSNDIERALAHLPWWQRHPIPALGLSILAVGAAILSIRLLRKRRRNRLLRGVSDIRVLPASRAGRADEGPPEEGKDSRAILGRFTILNGERAGEKLGLGGSGIRIGREPECCEIVLENPKVSRLHAEVVAVEGKVLLIDRHSSNGTWVNDRRIDRHILRDGDIIYFGGRNAVAVAFHA